MNLGNNASGFWDSLIIWSEMYEMWNEGNAKKNVGVKKKLHLRIHFRLKWLVQEELYIPESTDSAKLLHISTMK